MINSISPILVFCLAVVFFSFTPADLRGQSSSEETHAGQTDEIDTYVTGITSGRAKSLVGGMLALASVIIGWRFRNSSAKSRTWNVTGLVLGILAIALGILHLATKTGGFGTGGGKAGAMLALAFGIGGTLLNALALRSKRAY